MTSTQLDSQPIRSWLPSYISLGIVWGASFLFIEKALTFLTPVGVTFFRCFFGAATLWILVLLKRFKPTFNLKLLTHLWIVGLLLNVIPGVLFAFAQERVSSILAGIMNALTPIMSVLMILFVFKSEKLSANRILGIVLGFIGVLIILIVGESIGSFSWSAFFALFTAVLCYGIAFPYMTKFVIPHKVPTEILATFQVSLSTLTLLPFAIHHGIDSYSPSLTAGASILALGILGSGFAYHWNFRIATLVGPSISSTVTYITPVVAVVLGLLLLGEPLTWNEPVGGLIVLIGSALAQGRFRLVKE